VYLVSVTPIYQFVISGQSFVKPQNNVVIYKVEYEYERNQNNTRERLGISERHLFQYLIDRSFWESVLL